MPRFNKWIPFFEEKSERRDVLSWYDALEKHLTLKFSERISTGGLKIVGLVSDRAKALVKLGKEAYLNVCSMPDLFHFMQDLGHLGGLQIGRKYKKTLLEKEAILKGQQEKLTKEQQATVIKSDELIEVYETYRVLTRKINQTIHPFNDLNKWSKKEVMNKSLLQAVRKISYLAEQIEIKVDIAKASKILRQIPDIVTGVGEWVNRNQAKIKNWVVEEVINEAESLWIEHFLLPAIYWTLQLERTKKGRKNPELMEYYQKRMEQSRLANSEYLQDLTISYLRQEMLFEMTYQMAASFHRSSSQVEGRNGYLAFIHHGQKGIPVQKRKALTVIHNFDTKRNDGSTPAQRLFRQDFPDLFEFLCHNVTGFKEPRKRKTKSLKNSYLQP